MPGDPIDLEPDVLWRMVQETRTSYFGASPTYVGILEKAGIVLHERFDLSSLRPVMLTTAAAVFSSFGSRLKPGAGSSLTQRPGVAGR